MSVAPRALRVLSWNLFHGRSRPPSRRCLRPEFERLLADSEWDVALLQEVPPWWPPRLARAAGAEARSVLTSRNAGLCLRRALAERRPELMKSNGGGANAVLARRAIAEHVPLRLRTWPERRVAQLVRLEDGTTLANYHASTRVPLAEEELARLWRAAAALAREGPLVVGGDLNLRDPRIEDPAAELVASRDVDHLFARGLEVRERAVLERRVTLDGAGVELSDHPPLAATLVPAGG